MRVPARGRRRWRALAFAAVPAALLVTTTVQASPPTDPPGQPVEIPDPAPTRSPNLAPATPATDIPVDAEAIAGSYIVVMAADPVVSYTGDEPGLAATAVAPDEKVDTDSPAVEEYVEHLETEQQEVLAASGVGAAVQGQSFTYALNGFEATLDEAGVAALLRQSKVANVVPNTLRQLTTDNTPQYLGLSAPKGPWASGFTGEDVVVGVIDSGIWPEHPSLADDGTYDDLPEYDDVELDCDFGDTAYNEDDAEFECNNKLLGAYDMRTSYKEQVGAELYDSARDYDGHGTHTATTAAGNRDVRATLFGIDRGLVSGIAPRARVIAYSACGSLGCVTSDLLGAVDQAVADGVDVINYSIGGGASLTDPVDMAFLFAADANVWVATSNGNDGPGAETVGGPASVPWVTAVGASTQNRTFSATARLANGQIAVGASITNGTTGGLKPLVDAEALGNELCEEPDEGEAAFSADITGKIVLCLRGGNARVDKSRVVAAAGGAGMILYNPNDVQALVTDNHWVPSVHINFTSGQFVKGYIDAVANPRASITAGKKVNAQGSVMADFSSRGANPVAPDIIKPDVTGPGVNILAGNTPTPWIDNEGPGAPGQLFQSISGTSMSSPHVAGLFALLRQAHPEWSAAMAKSAVMTTARQDVVKEDGTTPADPFDMGAGYIDPAGSPTKAGSVFAPGLVYDAGLFDYYGFLCDADPGVFADPAGLCSTLAASGYATTATDLNLASIGASAVAGSITVERTVTSVADKARRWTSDIEAPPGFEVTVEPSSFRIEPGETVTYSVTITSVDAPVDEWRFGSLTWSSGSYTAYSPIAAKAALFAAPDTVTGEGTEGSVTIPVGFGYTGAYTAAAHGPVADTPLEGSVAQDPDQEFNPNDPVGVAALPIDVAGSALLRLTLSEADLAPDGNGIDIDLYLVKDNRIVAASTAGGTSEQIDLVLPADGAYTLYVHGWLVGEDNTVDFTVHSWSVPLAPDTGALQIDSAPESAVTGAVDEVVASWSGLEPGTEYLGAVSHSDDAGLLGLTLVEITS
jgi:subtilisin family serine protease